MRLPRTIACCGPCSRRRSGCPRAGCPRQPRRSAALVEEDAGLHGVRLEAGAAHRQAADARTSGASRDDAALRRRRPPRPPARLRASRLGRSRRCRDARPAASRSTSPGAAPAMRRLRRPPGRTATSRADGAHAATPAWRARPPAAPTQPARHRRQAFVGFTSMRPCISMCMGVAEPLAVVPMHARPVGHEGHGGGRLRRDLHRDAVVDDA